jgi:hypothetical protein
VGYSKGTSNRSYSKINHQWTPARAFSDINHLAGDSAVHLGFIKLVQLFFEYGYPTLAAFTGFR